MSGSRDQQVRNFTSAQLGITGEIQEKGATHPLPSDSTCAAGPRTQLPASLSLGGALRGLVPSRCPCSIAESHWVVWLAWRLLDYINQNLKLYTCLLSNQPTNSEVWACSSLTSRRSTQTKTVVNTGFPAPFPHLSCRYWRVTSEVCADSRITTFCPWLCIWSLLHSAAHQPLA